MKYSNSYIFYPNNQPLEKALDHFRSLLVNPNEEDLKPDTSVAVQDNFIHTRGNFEQKSYSSNVLDAAKDIFSAILEETKQEEHPLDWAEIQNSLGNVLSALGQQWHDAELYKKAIVAFNHSLTVYNQEETPLEWAALQYNLGTALQSLGRLEKESRPLKLSADAYINALLVWKKEDNLDEWAMTMHQLGAAYHSFGKLLEGNRTFQKAVVAYKNALTGFDADLTALELAATHNNRGAVLHHLGESEQNPGRIEEAIRSYETAWTVCMEQQLPIHLAVMCRVNKATARCTLAEMTKDAALAEEAADDFEVVIELFQNSCQPLCVKHCKEQMEKAQSMM